MSQMNRMTTSHASGALPPSTSPVLGPRVPQNRGPLFRLLGRLMLRLAGWELTGTIPDIPQFVLIVAPHTSNWDFFVGVATKWAMGFRVIFLGKHTLFRPPMGWFMRALGGVPVNRSTSNLLVDQTTSQFAEHEQLVLVLAPEGTRKHVSGWRSGFWHIARAANVPVVCTAFDYALKQVRFGPTLQVNANVDAAVDIARIKSHYDDVQGRHPALQA